MRTAFIIGKDIRYADDTDGASILALNMAFSLSSKGPIDIYTPVGYSGHIYSPKKALSQTSRNESISENITLIRFPVGNIDIQEHTNPRLNYMNRVKISYAEADYFSNGILEQYDLVQIIHMAHAFGIVINDYIPKERTIVFPMMLGNFYKKFNDVPDEYIELEKKTLQKISYIQSPSESERKVLLNDYSVTPEKIIMTPRGYNPQVFMPKYRKELINDKIEIVSGNMIRPQKGQKIFIDIAKEAKERKLNININLAGITSTSYSEQYNQYSLNLLNEIKYNNLEDCFTFHGVLSQIELANLMNRCHIALVPSITETFGKFPLECVVSGLPTIVYDDVPAFREFITDRKTGLIINRDKKSSIDAIEELTKNDNLYSGLSRDGIASGQNFTWNNVMKRLMDEYKIRGLIR